MGFARPAPDGRSWFWEYVLLGIDCSGLNNSGQKSDLRDWGLTCRHLSRIFFSPLTPLPSPLLTPPPPRGLPVLFPPSFPGRSGVFFRVSGFGLRILGVGCRVEGVGWRVEGGGWRVYGVGCRV